MLSENKIRLMTKIAVYEKTEGAKNARMNAYFRGDYLSSQMLRSFLCATVSFLILLAVYCYYGFEELMLSIYSMDLMSFFGRIIVIYLLCTAAVLILTYVVYTRRYSRMQKQVQRYYKMLSVMAASYKKKEEV